jgi:hypothetical protein
MKFFAAAAIAAAATLALSEGSSHRRSRSRGVHHHKFQETEVIEVNATCPNGGAVLLCADAAYECQDDGTGVSRCLPRGDAFLDEIDDSTTTPWSECSTTDTSLPSKCLFDFQCLCHDTANTDCYCMPPDAYRLNRGVVAEGCTLSNGTAGACDPGKYCRTKGSIQECADAPYLPGIPLYGDCTGDEDADDVCADGLTCEAFNDFFSLCVSAQ